MYSKPVYRSEWGTRRKVWCVYEYGTTLEGSRVVACVRVFNTHGSASRWLSRRA